MVLVDTSVWIATFRARAPLDLEAVVSFDDVVTCLPVIQEVLQGFADERAYAMASRAMWALPIVESPMGDDVVRHAVDLYRAARRHGYTVRSSVDCIIAACAIRNDLTVLHKDRDFRAIARISTLQHQSITE